MKLPLVGLQWAFLLLIILLGIYVRTLPIQGNFSNDDEIYNFISAIKLNNPHPGYDPTDYNPEQPFLGKKILGLLTGIHGEFSLIQRIPASYYYNYLAAPELAEVEGLLRYTAAAIGILTLALFFILITTLFGWETGLLATALASVSVGIINYSRVFLQDVVLAPFLLLLMFAAWKYYESSPTDEGQQRRQTIYLLLTIALFILCLLIRVGQPVIIGIGILVALYSQPQKFKAMLAGMLGAGSFFLMQYPYALKQLVKTKGQALQAIHGDWIVGFISQNGYAFTLGTVIGLILLVGWVVKKKNGSIRNEAIQQWKGVRPSIQFFSILALTTIPFLFLTQAGTQPRYYVPFFFLLIAGIAILFTRTNTRRLWPLLFLLLAVDAYSVMGNEQTLTEYSVLGLQPIYLAHSHEREGVLHYLEEKGIQSYYTNDPWLTLRDKRAKPLPPSDTLFAEIGRCRKIDSKEWAGATIVYRKMIPIPIDVDPFLCRYVQQLPREEIPLPHDDDQFVQFTIYHITN